MAIISRFPGGGGGNPTDDLPPLLANMACTTSDGYLHVTTDDFPEEYLHLYKEVTMIVKKEAGPESPTDGTITVHVKTDGSYTIEGA